MYQEFFGFTEQPFSIAPDPRFLFLGPRHQEALLHLRHGLTGSGGFLLLTGEVGTGKTTLSRTVISELEHELDVVFILNPRLSERELLASIAEGFGIANVNEQHSLKTLTDVLSQYLKAAAARDKHPVVLIDEAQHLFPAVLEQLRLLTNLESDSKKLLSVVLIGQPELRELLQRQELRQVAQRIVARYQLLPFTRVETEQYINHRLDLTGGQHEVFDKAARRAIWQATQGTPRLINLLCDRALQIAAQRGLPIVTRSIITEATGALPQTIERKQATGMKYWLLGAVVIFIAASVLWQSVRTNMETTAQQSVASQPILPSPNTPATKTTQVEGMRFTESLTALAHSWQLGNIGLGQQPCERLARYNVLCIKAQASLMDVAALGIPVVAELHNGSTLLLRSASQGKEQDTWLIEDARGFLQRVASDLEPMLSGTVFLLINVPNFVNERSSVHWRDWVTTRIAARVPYSLQQAEAEQQRAWLLDTTTGMSMDDGWLFATLATAAHYEGPRFTDYVVTDFPLIRTAIVTTEMTESVTYTSNSVSLTQVNVPSFRFVWPAAQIETADYLNSPQSDTLNSNENPTRNVETLGKDMSKNAQPSYTLKAMFDDAVRSTPPLEPERRWGFDIESVTPTATEEQANSGVPLLTELTPEQRQKIPALSYEQHVYQSSVAERWIGLGQNRLREGDRLGDLKVISIQPGYSILSVGDLLFKVDALEDL